MQTGRLLGKNLVTLHLAGIQEIGGFIILEENRHNLFFSIRFQRINRPYPFLSRKTAARFLSRLLC